MAGGLQPDERRTTPPWSSVGLARRLSGGEGFNGDFIDRVGEPAEVENLPVASVNAPVDDHRPEADTPVHRGVRTAIAAFGGRDGRPVLARTPGRDGRARWRAARVPARCCVGAVGSDGEGAKAV